MSAYDRLGAAPPAIATREELQRRLAERARPQVRRDLTMDGADGAQIRQDAAQSNERRIELLQSRLEHARQAVNAGHRLSALRGLTRMDFERER